MNTNLLRKDVQDFIQENRNSDLSKLILKGSPFPEITVQELAVQIKSLKTSEKKLPTWFNAPEILFPPKLNLEQTSSEKTAIYKAEIINGERLIDITGGFGVDTYCFTKTLREVIYCEMNTELAEIASHNFKKLGAENIEVVTGNGITYLEKNSSESDWIFIDPARRDNKGGKVFRLQDCLPDVPKHLELLFSRTDNILIKTSPLLDLKAGLEELQNVVEIHIVSVENEVKELLWILKKNSTSEIRIKTINFQKKGDQVFENIRGTEVADLKYSLPRKFIYEPNPAIMKSGLFAELGRQTQTEKLHPNSHLFTSDEEKDFPGRIFQIIDVKQFNKKNLKKEFKGEKANITTRNFPESVSEIRKKFQIKDGGRDYLFFTTNLDNENIVIRSRKI
ncbi:class I SAM-dependent methyltransferase [Autumnicola psychrophila]|uniref:Class I SAM-dependent methyltransferase n=1 Tax=Autumnicola psychrophila TaxID=3075592 RepID=A0ABU3DUK7_9FLAO|nr:class I SAM-dependent methyltransferase [Zunongwangia sp. F225]MDT0687328.1 class I SAM-dependent methyltransferase [Zunongwangia sp. F225]